MIGGTGGGSATGSNGVFIPPGQPEVAAQLGQTIQPLVNAAANGGAGTPAASAYPMGQSFVSQFLTGQGQNQTYDNFANAALAGAQTGADYGTNTLFPQTTGASSQLNSAAGAGLPYAQQALQQGFNPAYSWATGMLANNPYYGQALQGAQQGAALGGAGANQLQGMAGQVGGAIPGLLQAGFDPQSALFNRGQQQSLDQSNAINAMSGLAGTPYGASVSANALGNYDINWQNQQLGREAQATGAAGSAAGQAANLYGAAPGLAQASAAMPGNAYTNQIGQILQGLNAQTAAGTQGGVGYSTILGGSGSGLQGAAGLGQGAAQGVTQNASMPYNTGSGIASNALSGLAQQTALGNQQYNLPQNVIGDFLQYMGLGQSASQLAGQQQAQNFSQISQGIGGIGSALGGANSLFGGGSSGGLLGGLFGGGAAAPALTDAAAGLGGGAALSASGGAELGAAALGAGGGTDALAAAAPLALSA